MSWVVDMLGVAGFAALSAGVVLRFGADIGLIVSGGLLLLFAVSAGLKSGSESV